MKQYLRSSMLFPLLRYNWLPPSLLCSLHNNDSICRPECLWEVQWSSVFSLLTREKWGFLPRVSEVHASWSLTWLGNRVYSIYIPVVQGELTFTREMLGRSFETVLFGFLWSTTMCKLPGTKVVTSAVVTPWLPLLFLYHANGFFHRANLLWQVPNGLESSLTKAMWSEILMPWCLKLSMHWNLNGDGWWQARPFRTPWRTCSLS